MEQPQGSRPGLRPPREQRHRREIILEAAGGNGSLEGGTIGLDQSGIETTRTPSASWAPKVASGAAFSGVRFHAVVR